MQKNILDVMRSLLPKTMKDNFQEGGWTWNSTKFENCRKGQRVASTFCDSQKFLNQAFE